MEMQPAETVEIRTIHRGVGSSSSSSSHTSSSNRTVPLHLDYDQLHLSDKEEVGKLRRPVRPVDRQRMRPWLMELLDVGNVYGLCWTNRAQGVFQISWRHASRLGWNLETDGDVFERWARHTGIYKEGDPPEPKRWKANFRCALHSLHDVVELTTALERRGSNACRTYRFLHSADDQGAGRKRAKSRKPKEFHTFERPRVVEEVVQETVETQQTPIYEFVTTEIVTNDDLHLVSESESEEDPKQDRVIVQQLELKPEMIGEEEFSLQHDHDYLAVPEKSQKTIVLRQGIGSIVLHKEVFDAAGEITQAKNGTSEIQRDGTSYEHLASAATSTAGWNTVLAPGLDSSAGAVKQKIKTKLTAKDLATARLLKEDQRAAYNLKYLLTGNKEDADVPTASSSLLGVSRKRKADSLSEHHHASISVGAEETVGTESVDEETGTMYPFVPQKTTKSPRRTASPRILSGAKARRQRSKSEKGDSESTEPLMSSCLLLLEAATRLDNAEKDKTPPGVRTRGKSRSSARTSVVHSSARARKNRGDKASESDDSASSEPAHTEETMIITADQDLHMVLRKTLESLKSRKAKVDQQEVEPTIAIEFAAESTEANQSQGEEIAIGEAQPKGIFSGSSINAIAETEVISKKLERSLSEADASVQHQQVIVDAGVGEAHEVIKLASAAVGSETVEGEQEEYVEMIMQADEDGTAYIEANSVPGEIIIESVEPLSGESVEIENEDGSDGSTITLSIPPGSVLLQTGDGTPIGLLDAQGKLTAFQSPEARSAISILTSKIADSPNQEVSVAEQSESSSSGPSVSVLSSTSSAEHSQVVKEEPNDAEAQVVIKQEPVIDDGTSDQSELASHAAVKVESVDLEDALQFVRVRDSDYPSTSPGSGSMPSDSHLNLEKITPYLVETVFSGLEAPLKFEEILTRFKKSMFLCKSSPSSYMNHESEPSSGVKSLANLCKAFLIRMCVFRSMPASNSAGPLSIRSSKAIRTLPLLQKPGSASHQASKKDDIVYNNTAVMDPTATFSLEEIPLFATAKGDSDSMSPASE